jgi:hypothetical protein
MTAGATIIGVLGTKLAAGHLKDLLKLMWGLVIM